MGGMNYVLFYFRHFGPENAKRVFGIAVDEFVARGVGKKETSNAGY